MSLQPTAVRDHLARLLQEEACLLVELETLLQTETKVLRGDDTDSIEQISATRQGCTSSLSRLALEREDSCRLFANSSTPATFDRLLAWCDPEGALVQRWQANLAHARRLRDLNDRNGALVAVKLNHVQTLLSALRGTTAQPDYTSLASQRTMQSSRELGTA